MDQGEQSKSSRDILMAWGFNGEWHEPSTRWQLLGNGKRAYCPAFMRFNRPDTLSPFDQGGFNAYAYCGGDPANSVDPTGQYLIPTLALGASTMFGVATGVGAVLTTDDRLKAGLIALATVSGAMAAASLTTLSGKWLMGRAAGPMPLSKPTSPRVRLKVRRNPDGSNAKAPRDSEGGVVKVQPRPRTEGTLLMMKDSIKRLRYDVSRRAAGTPRMHFARTHANVAVRDRLAPVQRRMLTAQGYQMLRDKPDINLNRDRWGRFEPEDAGLLL